MNAMQLIKESIKAGRELKYVTLLQKEVKRKRHKTALHEPVEPKSRAKPHVFGSRNDGSYTKKDHEEPKFRRKMRQASQKINRRRK